MTVKEFLKATSIGYPRSRPRVKCADGFSISIQANNFTYCTPRTYGDVEYEDVELGFPSAEDEVINDYAETNYEPKTRTVYPYTPIEVVEQLVEKHGGIVYIIGREE